MSIEEQESQAKLFKILMHPARLAILDILRDGEQCVCHLEAFLELRQAYISQQLMILREAGFVQDRRDGLNIYYRVSKPHIYPVIDAASQITKKNPTHGLTKSTTKYSQTTCDCPKCKNGANVFVAQE